VAAGSSGRFSAPGVHTRTLIKTPWAEKSSRDIVSVWAAAEAVFRVVVEAAIFTRPKECASFVRNHRKSDLQHVAGSARLAEKESGRK
jgi:hypothetical protein